MSGGFTLRFGGALRAPRPRSLLRAPRYALSSGATPRNRAYSAHEIAPATRHAPRANA